MSTDSNDGNGETNTADGVEYSFVRAYSYRVENKEGPPSYCIWPSSDVVNIARIDADFKADMIRGERKEDLKRRRILKRKAND